MKWYKDSEPKPIVSSHRVHLDRNGYDHILKIVKTQPSDFGEYTCEARNTEGRASASIHLTGNFFIWSGFYYFVCLILLIETYMLLMWSKH